MASRTSSISQALAGKSASLEIPKPSNMGSSVNSFDGYVAIGGKNGHAIGLPTPPNSISPNLPPHAFKAKLAKDTGASPPSQVDSDIDLQDALDHESIDSPTTGDELSASEGIGMITAAYLTKHHLADIVLDKGPIAIRHVMNQLSLTLPGFGDIPPAKARRIVVAALESRTGGGPEGEVEFEKVGWGRWDARVKGMPAKDRPIYSIQEGPLPVSASVAGSSRTPALKIPGQRQPRPSMRRPSHGSWGAESYLSTRSELGRRERDVAEDEADKMSIDGDEDKCRRTSFAQSGRRRSSQQLNFSDTDEEDWQSIGAAALRKGSLPFGVGNYTSMNTRSGSRANSYSPYPRSLPSRNTFNQPSSRSKAESPNLDFTGVDADSQEREAIEALLRMGSA